MIYWPICLIITVPCGFNAGGFSECGYYEWLCCHRKIKDSNEMCLLSHRGLFGDASQSFINKDSVLCYKNEMMKV